MEDNQSLAAYITFRQLYNNNTDHLSIIAEFIKRVIYSKKLNNFSISQIREYLNEEFDFLIPDSIIKSAINKIDFIKRDNNRYVVQCNMDFSAQSAIDKYYKEALVLNKSIITKLCDYIKDKGEHIVEEDILLGSLYDFIINDNRNDEYYKYISAFFIENEHDDTVKDFMNSISEGYILFAGIHYNSDISSSAIWQKPITIYLEPEILIYLAGYNGELFKTLAVETLTFIKEMNNKSKERRIKLCYFSDTKSEIEQLFFAAECSLREGRTVAELEETALQYLLSSSKEPADIVKKKVEFYNLLQSYGICEAADYNYYDKENQEYNISDLSLLQQPDDKIRDRYIEHLNCISILRKRNVTEDLKLSEFLILTETRKILELSKSLCKKNKRAPFAVNMGMLTNRLWFDLGKGFGGQKIPSSFDIVVKSRIILSRLLERSISKQFKTERERLKNGEVTREELIEFTICFKEANKLPDEITSENTDEILSLITSESVEEHRARLIKKSTEFKALEENYISTKSKHDTLVKQNERMESVILSDIESIKIELDKLKQEKESLICKVNSFRKKFLMGGVLLYILFSIYIIYLLYTLYPIFKGFFNVDQDRYEYIIQFGLPSTVFLFNVVICIIDVDCKKRLRIFYHHICNCIARKMVNKRLETLNIKIRECRELIIEKKNSLNH